MSCLWFGGCTWTIVGLIVRMDFFCGLMPSLHFLGLKRVDDLFGCSLSSDGVVRHNLSEWFSSNLFLNAD